VITGGRRWGISSPYWCNALSPGQRRRTGPECDEIDFWRPDLPGRRPFQFAAPALDSEAEPFVAGFPRGLPALSHL
jgi:hypothetical protein